MNFTGMRKWLALGLLSGSLVSAAPKNIIMLISDGWGYQQIKATNLYQYGELDQQAYEQREWLKYGMSTFSAEGDGYDTDEVDQDKTYVKKKPTDSAASGTALSTGKKTYDGAINISMEGDTLMTITERALALGKRAGVVSSVEWSHATPAAFVAHNESRNNYAAIAQEMVRKSGVDVIMGAGDAGYDNDGQVCTTCNYKYVGGQDLFDSLKAGQVEDAKGRTWNLVQDSATVDSLNQGTISSALPLMVVPKVYQTLQYNRSGADNADLPWADPRNAGISTLEQMTGAALNALYNDEGFFLMVEGGAVDWAGHGNHLGRLIEEQTDFNNTVDRVIQWVEANSSWDETLVIVTGDHETGYLTGAEFANVESVSEDNDTTWVIDDVTGEQGELPAHAWNSGSHTNQIIPFFAKGEGIDMLKTYVDERDNRRGDYLKNSEVGQAVHALWTDQEAIQASAPKYVFLMISDGCGYNCFDAADIYTGTTSPYKSWEQYGMTSYMYDGSYQPASIAQDVTAVNKKPTDSAASGTAFSTGKKTYKGSINMDIDGKPLKSITERFSEIGRSTGIVTSVEFSHATPASMFAHNESRNNYEAIAKEMIFQSNLDVIMGAGDYNYDDDGQECVGCNPKYIGGEETLDKLMYNNAYNRDGKWTLLQDSTAIHALASGETPERVIAVPPIYKTLQYNRSGADNADLPWADPRNSGIATLEQMTKAAVNVLDNNENGFFLMVEGGAVDWAGHGNHLGRMIEEQMDFNDAVQAAIDWVEDTGNDATWDNTMIIVTADHETGFLAGPDLKEMIDTTSSGDTLWRVQPVTGTAGELPAHSWNSGNHTNMLVPVYVKGAGSELVGMYADEYDPYLELSFTDNAEIGRILHQLTEGVAFAVKPEAVKGTMNGAGILEYMGTYASATTDMESATEITAYDSTSMRLFTVNAAMNQVDVIDMSDPSSPVADDTLSFSNGTPNSVAVSHGILAVALEASVKQDSGTIALYSTTDLSLIEEYTVGALPDMVAFTPDGKKIVVACEGEPNQDYTMDPEGNVAILDISGGADQAEVILVDFSSVAADSADLVDAGLLLSGMSTLAEDLEPEYVAISDGGSTAWITLQENNAVARIKLSDGTIEGIYPLGCKDHSLNENVLDAVDDGMIQFKNQPICGLYMPDAIAYMANAGSYFITANEGDGREYNAFVDEVKVKDLALDPDVFSFENEEDLAGMKVWGPNEDCTEKNSDGECTKLYSFGTRSFSIWDGTGNLVWDSGDQIERITAGIDPTTFNQDDGEMDGRSDRKGPEPEGVTVGKALDKTFAFVGLERTSGVMAWDVTDPENPMFVDYVSSSTDVGPEGILFIPAEESPIDTALVVVTYEISNTVSVYKLRGAGVEEVVGLGAPRTQLQSSLAQLRHHGNLVFQYAVPAGAYTLEVMDASGRIVAYASETVAAGEYQADFSRAPLAAGSYFVRLRTQSSAQTMVVNKK